MIEWARKPAPIDPNIGTVGIRAAEAAHKARAEGNPWGLGVSSYPITDATSERRFDGNFGVHKPGPDRRVLRPRTDLPGVGTRIK